MRIIEQGKYYILVHGYHLLVSKPWKFPGSAIWHYNDLKNKKYPNDHHDKLKRGKPAYPLLHLIEIDVLNPKKSRFMKGVTK